MELSWLEIDALDRIIALAKNDKAKVVVVNVDWLSELLEKYDRFGQFQRSLDERVRELEALNRDLEGELAGARAEADAATAGLERCRDVAIDTLELIDAGKAVKA